ncbi:MAG: hypothetical protein M3440_08190 [Chloroflexota bacterium]|nr:hypothetical protein [Chloroflexota bacterium]
MYDPTNAVTARALLEDALALGTSPTLSPVQVNRAFDLASSLDTDGVTVLYTAANLNRSAAWGWNVKAGLTAAQYDIGGQGGSSLTRSQLHDHCKEMARLYGSGVLSVTGASTGRSGIGSIGLSTELSRDYWDLLS